ncbi:MAG: hypothetical protein CBE47_00520 [Pelagibacteraceae bacterium TMED287]|nr:MAG: hypothetical protein CBE47_00520 [Pelagibacteraceae bacterium TMED287]|tara:strand:- start:1218 stop:2162 length:945 start_codon:yes stop_codon:yes gene_type:complete
MRKAIIISLSGPHLLSNEKILIKKYKPWGIILFKRNILDLSQTKNLITTIRKSAGDKKFPILIDEEGGTVTRLSNFLDNKIYSQKFFGELFDTNKKLALGLYENYLNSICSVLKIIGFNINTVPVLDILSKDSHKFISKRSYSKNLNTIRTLGSLCIDIYNKNKLATIIKHIPGHGPSKVDSHKVLPKIEKSYKNLIKSDFKCFKNMNSPLAMTAHIQYTKLDNKNVCTHSRHIIGNIIRKKIGYKGIILSDDISMKALKFDLVTNAKKSLTAGCNLVLYCGGKYKESLKLIREMPKIDNFTRKKTSELYKFLS